GSFYNLFSINLRWNAVGQSIRVSGSNVICIQDGPPFQTFLQVWFPLTGRRAKTLDRMAQDHFFTLRVEKRLHCLLRSLLGQETGKVISASIGEVFDPFQILFSLGEPALSFFKRTSSHKGPFRPSRHGARTAGISLHQTLPACSRAGPDQQASPAVRIIGIAFPRRAPPSA